MGALAADRDTVVRPLDLESVPAAAAVKLYLGGAVASDAAGNANPAANTSGLRFRGMAQEQVDNSAGAAGDLNVPVAKVRSASWTAAGLAAGDVGKDVWFSDDQTVTLTPGYCYAGKIAKVVSATECFVDHMPAYAGIKPQATVADVAAMTAVNPAAITAANPAAITAAAAALTVADPAAITYAAPSGGATQDAEARASLAQSAVDVAAVRDKLLLAIDDLGLQKAELDKTITDVTAARAEVVKLVTDLTAVRAEVVKLVTDVTADKAKLNALLASDEAAGVRLSA